MKYRILPPEVWIEIRRMYEEGRPAWLICREFGIGKSTLMERRRRENWRCKSIYDNSLPDDGGEGNSPEGDATDGVYGDAELENAAGGTSAESGLQPIPARTPPDALASAGDPAVNPAAVQEVTRSHLRLAATIRRKITALLVEPELGAGTGNRRSRAALDAATALEKLQRVERVALGMNEREIAPTTRVVIMVPPKLDPETWQRRVHEMQARKVECEVLDRASPHPGDDREGE